MRKRWPEWLWLCAFYSLTMAAACCIAALLIWIAGETG